MKLNSKNEIDFDFYNCYDINYDSHINYEYKYYLYKEGKVILNDVKYKELSDMIISLFKEKKPNLRGYDDEIELFLKENNYIYQKVIVNKEQAEKEFNENKVFKKSIVLKRQELFKEHFINEFGIKNVDLLYIVFDKQEKKLSEFLLPEQNVNIQNIYNYLKELVDCGALQ